MCIDEFALSRINALATGLRPQLNQALAINQEATRCNYSGAEAQCCKIGGVQKKDS